MLRPTAVKLRIRVYERLQAVGLLTAPAHVFAMNELKGLAGEDAGEDTELLAPIDSPDSQVLGQQVKINASLQSSGLVSPNAAQYKRDFSLDQLEALSQLNNIPLSRLLSLAFQAPQAQQQQASQLRAAQQPVSLTVGSVNDRVQPEPAALLLLTAPRETARARAQARVLARMECNRGFGSEVSDRARAVLRFEDLGAAERMILEKEAASEGASPPKLLSQVRALVRVKPALDARVFVCPRARTVFSSEQLDLPVTAAVQRTHSRSRLGGPFVVWVGYQLLAPNVGTTNLARNGRWTVRLRDDGSVSQTQRPYFVAALGSDPCVAEQSLRTWLGFAQRSAMTAAGPQLAQQLAAFCAVRLVVVALPVAEPRSTAGRDVQLVFDAVQQERVSLDEASCACGARGVLPQTSLAQLRPAAATPESQSSADTLALARLLFADGSEAGGAAADPAELARAMFNEDGDTLSLLPQAESATDADSQARLDTLRRVLAAVPGFGDSCLRLVSERGGEPTASLAEAAYVECCSGTLLKQLQRGRKDGFFGPVRAVGRGFTMACGVRQAALPPPLLQIALPASGAPERFLRTMDALRFCYPGSGDFDRLVYAAIGVCQRHASDASELRRLRQALQRVAREPRRESAAEPWRELLLATDRPGERLLPTGDSLRLQRLFDADPVFQLRRGSAAQVLTPGQVRQLLWDAPLEPPNERPAFYNALPRAVDGVDPERFPEARPSWRVDTHADVERYRKKSAASLGFTHSELSVQVGDDAAWHLPFERQALALALGVRRSARVEARTLLRVPRPDPVRPRVCAVDRGGLLALFDSQPRAYFDTTIAEPLLPLAPPPPQLGEAWRQVERRELAWSSDAQLRALKQDVDSALLLGCAAPYSAFAARFVRLHREADLRRRHDAAADPETREVLQRLLAAHADLEQLPVRLDALLDEQRCGPLPRLLG
jgi:hypothetical protein